MTVSRAAPFLTPVLGLVLLLSLLWGALFAFIHHDHTQVEENAYRETENYSIAFEEYAHNIILNVDNALHYLGNLYIRSQQDGRPINRVLIDGYAPIKTFQFSVIGPDGLLKFSNLAPAQAKVDLSDREHFRVHLNTGEDRLFISRPILGRVSGKWSIQFTRKIVMPDGSFGGVLVLSAERREFEDFFDRVDLGQRGLIALFGLDGWMRARGTQVPESIRSSEITPLPQERPYFGASAPTHGRLRTTGHYDGVDRLGAFRRVRDVPLVVSVQLAADEVFAEHRERVDRAVLASLTLSTVAVFGLGVVLFLRRQLNRKNAEMQALHAALAAREIGAARHRLSEAQRLARLGIIERDPATGQWMACEHAQALLGLPVAAAYSLDQLLANAEAKSGSALRALLTAPDLSLINQEVTVELHGDQRFLRAVGCAPATEDEPDFVTLQDISARRASEVEHARLRERMEEASRLESLGTLAGGIAHEINTPAQYVGDNLEFLRGCVPELLTIAETAANARGLSPQLDALLDRTNVGFLAKEVPEAIMQGCEGVTRIGKIVQAVKEFCYPSSRDPQPCDLNHMIESAATVTRNAWKYSAELSLELDPALPLIDAIEGEINQVLINLIVNAAQAIAEQNAGLGRIVISTWQQDDGVAFSVADDGPGIHPDLHKRIFELFYTTKPPGQGTGQGLAISSAIVRRHGGSIVVASEPGAGARFTVLLPLHSPLKAARADSAEAV